MLPTCSLRGLAVLTLGLALGGSVDAAVHAQTSETGTTGVGELRVASRPSGASVYLDGSLVGVTPLTVPNVTAGTHRVKLSRRGYLDRESQIEVPAGGAGDMQVDLAKDHADEPAVSGAAGEPRRTGGDERKLLALLAGTAVATTALVIANQGADDANDPPTGGTIVGDPPIGVVGVASTLAVTGVIDPESPVLTYSWTFGDGATGTGQRVSHTYATPAFYTVNVVASDGEASTTVSGSHLVTTLTGLWRGSIEGLETRVDIRQEGAALGGTFTAMGFGGVPVPLSGTVRAPDPGGFAYPVEFSAGPPCCAISFVGSLDIREGINRLSGTAQGKRVTGLRWVLNR